ncbi:hypothetical protein BGZ73_002029 [Actinomortierella ambigua]|nr:hypothetical protein BGZ73_002029 [Actinomortierella ambigua]
MVVKDIKFQSISAPIPVPGTQLKPTTPSAAALSAAGSTTIIHISSLGGGHHDSKTTTTTVSSMTAGKATLSNGSSGSGGSASRSNSANSSTIVSASRAASSSGNQNGQSGNNNNNNSNNHHSQQQQQQQQQQGLRRFTSIGSKKLSNENQTLRAKVAELERYLTGLKEELILAHRQIHAKAQESKVLEERKSLEIHELGQHIQRCEFDLLAKTAECETLQRKLQYQTKDHMTKLKQIDMLETEIMDFRRLSLNGSTGKPIAGGPGGVAGTMTPSSGSLGSASLIAPGSGRASDETSGEDGLESVRSSACLEAHRASSLYEGTHEQFRLLKEESLRKNKTVEELMDKIDRLNLQVLTLEREKARLVHQQKECAKEEEVDEEDEESHAATQLALEDLSRSLSVLGAAATFPESTMESNYSAIPESLGPLDLVAPSRQAATGLSVNSVGYDWQAEHPKLLYKYQALQRSYVEVLEYLQMVENENRELKMQIIDGGLLDIAGLPSPSTTSPTAAVAEMSFAPGVMPASPTASPSSSPSTSRVPAVPGKSPQRLSKDGRQSPVAVL